MNLQRALEEQKQQTAPDVQQIPGLLGVPLNGQRRVEVAGRNAYVYVRLRANQNEVMQAYNNQVAPAYNLPVLLERQGNKYIVIGVDTARYENNWTSQSPFLPRHGNTHSFDLESGGAGDIVWVHLRQIVPALVFPSGSVGGDSVIVNPYVLRDDNGLWKYVGNTGTTSFSPYRPTSPTGAVMALVYLDDTSGNPYFLINSGTVFSNSLTGTSQIAPFIPQTTSRSQIPLAAIRLITGTSQISWDNIYDVRQWVHTFTSGSSGGISSVAVQDEGSPQGSVTTFNFVGDNVQATISGSVARIYVTGSSSGGINTGTLDARYLKLDASNDPVTGPLQILNPTGTSVAFTITQKDSEYQAFQFVHNPVPGRETQDDTGSIERLGPSGTIFPYPALKFVDSETANQSWVYGEIIQARKNAVTRTNIHPYATGAIINYVWDTDRVRPTGTIHTDFRVSGSSVAYVNVSGTFYSNDSPLIKEAPAVTGSYVRRNAGWVNQDPLYLPFGVYTSISPMAVAGGVQYPYAATVERTLTFTKWAQGLYVGGTNDGTNYWLVRLIRWSDSAVIASVDTSTSAGSTHLLLTTTNFSIASIDTSFRGIVVRVDPVGTPGSLFAIGPMLEITV